MNQRHYHQYNRFGSGLPLHHFSSGHDYNILHADGISLLNVVEKPNLRNMRSAMGRKDFIKKLIQRSVRDTMQLNYSWVRQMSDPAIQLREKMTLFWHDHFACRSPFTYLLQQQNNTIRTHALGSFRTLLFNVSRDPAMLQFLNNQQNRKDQPNENFAREVMELFTLGRGKYSETDIKNAARAFTGWAFNPITGQFLFRSRVHDDGIKTFRGKTGRLTGEDILEILLEDRDTAAFVTRKFWSYFVSDEIFDEDIIASLSKSFYESDYDILGLITDTIESDWFYDPRFTANRIKSPVELLAGIQTNTGGVLEDHWSAGYIQRALGQILFYPPNVGGWPQGKAWIDSSSLTHRLNLPIALIEGRTIELNTNDDGDVKRLVGDMESVSLKLTTDWNQVSDQFNHNQNLLRSVERYLLPTATTDLNRKMIANYAGQASDETDYVKRLYMGIMSVPEYQLS